MESPLDGGAVPPYLKMRMTTMVKLTPTKIKTTTIPKMTMIMIPIPKMMEMMILAPTTHNQLQEWNTTTTIKLTKKTT